MVLREQQAGQSSRKGKKWNQPREAQIRQVAWKVAAGQLSQRRAFGERRLWLAGGDERRTTSGGRRDGVAGSGELRRAALARIREGLAWRSPFWRFFSHDKILNFSPHLGASQLMSRPGPVRRAREGAVRPYLASSSGR